MANGQSLRKRFLPVILAVFWAALLVGLLPLPSGAAKRTAGSKAAPAVVRLFAWKVWPPGPGGHPGRPGHPRRPDYLVGTAHVTLPTGLSISREFLRALAGCDRFLMEADLETVTPEVVARYIVLGEGKTLEHLLPAEALDKLEVAVRPIGLPREQMNRLEPWYLSLLLTLPSNSRPDRILDGLLMQAALRRKLSVGYLETADDVLGAMDAVDGKEQVAMLVETLDDLDGQRRQARELEAAYLQGDLQALEKLLLQADRVNKYPDFYERLLFARNRAWLPKVESAVQNTDAMIAVGLGHLVGRDGLLESLRKRGYRIERTRL